MLIRVRYDRDANNPHEPVPGSRIAIVQPTGYWCHWAGAYIMHVDGVDDWPLTLVRKEGVLYPETHGCCCPSAVVLRGIPAAVRALVEQGNAEIVTEDDLGDYKPTPEWSASLLPTRFG